jgi:hypothetical protein
MDVIRTSAPPRPAFPEENWNSLADSRDSIRHRSVAEGVLKLFCCFTPAHEILLRRYFLPSLPEGFEVEPVRVELEGAGDFSSREYLQCLEHKAELIMRSLEENPDVILVWSDIDILFLDATPAQVAQTFHELGREILFQREKRVGADVNPGLMVCRSTPGVLRFYRRVLAEMERTGEKNDQPIINRLLREGADLSWGHLPLSYYARSHGWPPPREMAVYHANLTLGKDALGQKIRQFEELKLMRKYRWPAIGWIGLKKTPRKLMRMAGLVSG